MVIIHMHAGVAGVFQSLFEFLYEAGADRSQLDCDEAGPLGAEDMAYSRSHFTLFGKDGNLLDRGKYEKL